MNKSISFGLIPLLFIPVISSAWATTDLSTLGSPDVTITPTSGPPGTEITITVSNLPDISKEQYPYPELYIYLPFSQPFGVTLSNHCEGQDCFPIYTYNDAINHNAADRTVTFSLFSTNNPKPVYLNGLENSVCDVVMNAKTIERFSTLCNTKDEPTGTYQIKLAWALQSDLEQTQTAKTVQFTVTPGSPSPPPQTAENASTITKQYQNGEISEAQFEAKLKALGWNDEDIRQAKAVAGKLHQSGAPAPEQMQQIQQGVQKAAELNSQPTEQTVQTEPYVQVETIPNPAVQQKSEQPTVQVDTGANSSQQNNASWNMVTIGASIGAAAAIGGGIFAVKTRKVRN
ncbi:MAG: hypothetical protein AUF74_02005 [Thaumarchaeota archaeon 13_1_20CM_2_38_5]|nr:MAG: hypothetical protein AUF74_02005 [Thaumarchaeota archaeon 13_1_20CM_2_38_5]